MSGIAQARRSLAPAGLQARNVRSSRAKVSGPASSVYFHSAICSQGFTSSPVSSAQMRPPGKLLLSAAVALLVLGDAVTRTTATTTTTWNASLRAAVDTGRSEERGFVHVKPNLDEERMFTRFFAWVKGLGSTSRSSSVKVPEKPQTMTIMELASELQKKKTVMGKKLTSAQKRERIKHARGLVRDFSKLAHVKRSKIPSHLKKISKGGVEFEDQRAAVFNAWQARGISDLGALRKDLQEAGVEKAVIANLVKHYHDHV
uniref:RxLR effector protein n=1 Tax=Peronospora matthiolae TaxID=2874970 RepID=A0AAV1VF41_9STRA